MGAETDDSKQPAPIGLGHFGRTQPEAVGLARTFLVREGVSDSIFLALNGGRAKGSGVPIPRLNASPKLVVASSGWWILNRAGDDAYAAGRLDEIRWAATTNDGFKVLLTNAREIRFFTGSLNKSQAASIFLSAVVHARLESAGFSAEVPAQRPLLLAGAHYGGYGTPLPSDAPVVMALSGKGICAISPGADFERPLSALRGLQVGGVGEYTTGGGWIGGGFGVRGALEGAAFATVMNWLTTRKHMDSLLRLSFENAEATFGLETHAPGRLEIELSALLAALRGPDGQQLGSALGLTTLAERRSAPIVGPAAGESAGGFCGHCGAARIGGHKFCTSCGSAY